MTTPAELESILFLLKDDLAEKRRLRDRGITLEAVYNRMGALDSRIDIIVRDQIEHGIRFDRYGQSIRSLKKEVNWLKERVGANGAGGDSLEPPSSSPGGRKDFDPEDSIIIRADERNRANELVRLRREVERHESQATWWKRQWWHWTMSAIFALAVGVLMFLLGRK